MDHKLLPGTAAACLWQPLSPSWLPAEGAPLPRSSLSSPSAPCIACSHHQAFVYLPQGALLPPPKLCLAPRQRNWLQVEMWLEARHTVPSVVAGVDICKGERVLMEVSRKFTVQDIRELAFKSGFFVQVCRPRLSVP